MTTAADIFALLHALCRWQPPEGLTRIVETRPASGHVVVRLTSYRPASSTMYVPVGTPVDAAIEALETAASVLLAGDAAMIRPVPFDRFSATLGAAEERFRESVSEIGGDGCESPV